MLPAAGRTHLGGRSLAPLAQAGSSFQDTAARVPGLHCSSLADLIPIPLLHRPPPNRIPAATRAHFHGLILVPVPPLVARHGLNHLVGEACGRTICPAPSPHSSNPHLKEFPAPIYNLGTGQQTWYTEASLSQEQKGPESWLGGLPQGPFLSLCLSSSMCKNQMASGIPSPWTS